ncbi:uncharacterized protein Dvar_29880 [Desulfosarcina variabilis str. Montpellier]|uniref:DUF4347 domain-containing protein n=1 Tax=Desulfosarcina variabilis TaxID=2300 RepID=UPI003AFABFC3
MLQNGDVLAGSANAHTLAIQYRTGETSLDDLLERIAAGLGGRKAAVIGIGSHHSGENAFYLTGREVVSLGSTLSGTAQQDFWKKLGTHIAAGGRIDLLACNLARGDKGALLISALQSTTGLSFAASTDATGNPAFGGNWLLETASVDVRDIYFAEPAIGRFSGVMAQWDSQTKLVASAFGFWTQLIRSRR